MKIAVFELVENKRAWRSSTIYMKKKFRKNKIAFIYYKCSKENVGVLITNLPGYHRC